MRPAIILVTFLAMIGTARAEVTRTLRVELSGNVGAPFAVENLAGAMTIGISDQPGVVAVATIHAESQALADAVRFEQVSGVRGVPTLRVRYPKEHDIFRYPLAGRSYVEYDGRQNPGRWPSGRARLRGCRGASPAPCARCTLQDARGSDVGPRTRGHARF